MYIFLDCVKSLPSDFEVAASRKISAPAVMNNPFMGLMPQKPNPQPKSYSTTNPFSAFVQ